MACPFDHDYFFTMWPLFLADEQMDNKIKHNDRTKVISEMNVNQNCTSSKQHHVRFNNNFVNF